MSTPKKELSSLSPKKTVIGGNKLAINGLFDGELKRELEMDSLRKDLKNNEKILMEKIDECMAAWNLFEKEINEKISESESILNGKKRTHHGLLHEQSTYISPKFYIPGKKKDPIETTIDVPKKDNNDPNYKKNEQEKIDMIDNGFKKRRQQLETPKKDRNIQTLRNHYGITQQSNSKQDDEENLYATIKILKQLVEKFISPIEGVNLKKVTNKKGKSILIFSSKTTEDWLNQYKIESNIKKEFMNRLGNLESIKPFRLSTAVEKIKSEPNEIFWSMKLAKKYKIKKIPFNVFDMSLEEIMVHQQKLHISCPIPIILYHLTYMLVKTGGLFAKEVFRISPSINDLEAVINQISKGNYDIKLPKSATACYIPANCIKQLLGSMSKKNPILLENAYNVPEGLTIHEHAESVYNSLSQEKQSLFKFLAAISRKVAHNFEDTKINSSAIAMLFSITLFPEIGDIGKDVKLSDPNLIKKELERTEKKAVFLEALLQTVPFV